LHPPVSIDPLHQCIVFALHGRERRAVRAAGLLEFPLQAGRAPGRVGQIAGVDEQPARRRIVVRVRRDTQQIAGARDAEAGLDVALAPALEHQRRRARRVALVAQDRGPHQHALGEERAVGEMAAQESLELQLGKFMQVILGRGGPHG